MNQTIYKFLKKCKVRYQRIRYALTQDKTQLYGGKFYEVGVSSVPEFVWVLCSHFNPRSVVDVGCGRGEFLYHFSLRGVEVKGYEGSLYAVKHTLVHKDYVERVDLVREINPGVKYDLALCLEVAEHIEGRSSQVLVKTLTNLSDTIVFTAAPPGQGGHYHINERPYGFWIELFKNKRFELDRELTEVIKGELERLRVPYWYRRNLLVFRRGSE